MVQTAARLLPAGLLVFGLEKTSAVSKRLHHTHTSVSDRGQKSELENVSVLKSV